MRYSRFQEFDLFMLLVFKFTTISCLLFAGLAYICTGDITSLVEQATISTIAGLVFIGATSLLIHTHNYGPTR